MPLVDSPTIEHIPFEEIQADPYPFYARLRRELPVVYSPEMGSWLITTWSACEAVTKQSQYLDSGGELTEEYFGPNILNVDGDKHLWLRAGVDVPLRPGAVKGYIEPLARPIAREYVGRLRDQGKADACPDLLELISVRVVGDVLGLRDVADEKLQYWFRELNNGLNNGLSPTPDPEITRAADEVKAELDAYMVGALERLKEHPDDSGLSHMVNSGIGGGPQRTFEDLIGTIRVIILGGFQEPAHAAAASLLGVLTNPDQYKAVLADPATTIPLAVHEGLRWISPFGFTQRRVVADIEVEGTVIPAGDEIQVVIGSAHRDERRYANGEDFDLFRKQVPTVAFGYGTHYCSGHFLSRELEAIMLSEVFAQLPNLRLDPGSPPVVRGFGVRGVKSLPIVWDR
jgi:cytochrome P450